MSFMLHVTPQVGAKKICYIYVLQRNPAMICIQGSANMFIRHLQKKSKSPNQTGMVNRIHSILAPSLRIIARMQG